MNEAFAGYLSFLKNVLDSWVRVMVFSGTSAEFCPYKE